MAWLDSACVPGGRAGTLCAFPTPRTQVAPPAHRSCPLARPPSLPLQLWLASSLLADSLAVAAQSLMARELGAGDGRAAMAVAARVNGLSAGLGVALGGAMALATGALPRLFTQDPEVLAIAAGGSEDGGEERRA